TQYCLTVHHFTSHGRSTSITKKCASRSECHFVGCHHSQDSEHTTPELDPRPQTVAERCKASSGGTRANHPQENGEPYRVQLACSVRGQESPRMLQG
ncbi:hypothetical protein P7K49_014118, partial [Saguinus oedipus]